MSNNYNYKFNPKKLSDKDIERHKDFDALLAQQKRVPLLVPKKEGGKIRRLFYLASAAAAAAILIGAFFYLSPLEQQSNQSATHKYLASQPFINPPLKNVQAKFASYKVDSYKGGEYEYESGSKIIVPPNAFINESGKLVEGDVDISYTEFHDYVDFFLSGIPMTYDSASMTYHFESAGMIQIFAEQDGNPVQMQEGKSIDIILVSELTTSNVNVSPKDFNVYKLNEKERNWTYEGKDNMTILAKETLENTTTEASIKKNLNQQLAQLDKDLSSSLADLDASFPKPDRPIKPQRSNGSENVFSLDLDDENLNFDDIFENEKGTKEEIKAKYEAIVWQLAPGYSLDEENWDNMRLKKISATKFELTLINESKNLKVIVNPVLGGDEYQKALSDFEEKMIFFTKQMEEREANMKAQKDALKLRFDEQKNAAKASSKQQVEMLKKGNTSTDKMIKRKVVNRFKATSFGIWNCDRPIPPDATKLKARFVDAKSQKQFNAKLAYITNKKHNTIARFYAEKGTEVAFNSDTDNLLWIVTEDEKIAIFKPEEFKRINQKKGTAIFNMNVIDKDLADEKDVREVLSY